MPAVTWSPWRPVTGSRRCRTGGVGAEVERRVLEQLVGEEREPEGDRHEQPAPHRPAAARPLAGAVAGDRA